MAVRTAAPAFGAIGGGDDGLAHEALVAGYVDVVVGGGVVGAGWAVEAGVGGLDGVGADGARGGEGEGLERVRGGDGGGVQEGGVRGEEGGWCGGSGVSFVVAVIGLAAAATTEVCEG